MKSPKIHPILQSDLPSLKSLPSLSKRIGLILEKTFDQISAENEKNIIQRAIRDVINHVRKCLRNKEPLDVMLLMRSFLGEVNLQEHFKKHYGLSTVPLSEFYKLSMVEKLFILLGEKNRQNGGIFCHQWSIFWREFWLESIKGTDYEGKAQVSILQKSTGLRHSICLVSLDQDYFISISKTGHLLATDSSLHRDGAQFKRDNGEILACFDSETEVSAFCHSIDDIVSSAQAQQLLKRLKAIPD